MKKILLSALVLSGAIFTSCDKSDDQDDQQASSAIYLPSKLTDESETVTFNYDSQDRILEYNSISESDALNVSTTKITFNYTGDELVSAKEVYTSGTYTSTENYTFVYQNNQVTITNQYANNSGSSETITNIYNLDGNGKLLSGDGATVTYDNRGNVSKMIEEDDFQIDLEYNNENGIFKHVKTPQFALIVIFDDYYMFKVNNPTKAISTDLDTNETYTNILTYQYNQDRYPTVFTATDAGDVYNLNIEYIKK